MVFLHVAACLTKTKFVGPSYSRSVATCLGETIISTFMLLFIASCLKKLSLCFPCFLGTRSPNDKYLHYFTYVMPLASILFTDFRFCMCLASWALTSEITTVPF
jgi:hypothetical protein